MKYVIPTLLFVLALVTPASCVVKSIHFDQDCCGYLKQAADANTAEIALERLNIALDYIERNHLTYGYTSVLWQTEDENVGFWYKNLKACQSELKACMNGTQLEKSNVLMKVRESLTDMSDGKTRLTVPKGISRYPNNTSWMVFGWMSMILIIICPTWIVIKSEILEDI